VVLELDGHLKRSVEAGFHLTQDRESLFGCGSSSNQELAAIDHVSSHLLAIFDDNELLNDSDCVISVF